MDYRGTLLVEEPTLDASNREILVDPKDPTPMTTLYDRHVAKPACPRASMRESFLTSFLVPVAESAALAMQDYQTPAGFFDLEKSDIKGWLQVFAKNVAMRAPPPPPQTLPDAGEK